MKRRQPKALVVVCLLLLGVLGTWWESRAEHKKKEPHMQEFHHWRNRPKEPFRDAKKVFGQVQALLSKHYYGKKKLSQEALYRAALQGMLHYIDPKLRRWNRLISPAEYKELRTSLHNEIAGVGIHMRFSAGDGAATVLKVIPGGPAQAAGLQRGDKILQVDGKSYKGKTIRDMVYAIRGKVGTRVKLTILRGIKLHTKEVTRNKLKWETVESKVLPQAIGYLRIAMFARDTPKHIARHLKRLKEKKVRALLIDLRMNRGGALKASIQAAGMFLKQGAPIVRLRKRDKPEEVSKATGPDHAAGWPIAVLMNGKTASGAELFAAALKESRGARLIGTKTYGKWNVQMLTKLSNGFWVKYTVGQFFSPRGKSYQGRGLRPDITIATQHVTRHAATAQDPLLHDPPVQLGHILLRQTR